MGGAAGPSEARAAVPLASEAEAAESWEVVAVPAAEVAAEVEAWAARTLGGAG